MLSVTAIIGATKIMIVITMALVSAHMVPELYRGVFLYVDSGVR